MKLRELRDILIDEKVPLSAVMRHAKVLASELNSLELLSWTDKEMKGYDWDKDKDEFPDYRIISTETYGHFAGPFGSKLENAPLATIALPEHLQEYATKHHILGGVKTIESHVAESGEGMLKFMWPANTVAVISNKIYEHMNCIAAWKVINRAHLEQILDTIRNRLLDFILEVEKAFPEYDAADVPNDMESVKKVTYIFNTKIYNSSNVAVAGPGSSQSVLKQGSGINIASVKQEDKVEKGTETKRIKTGFWARFRSGLGKLFSAIGLGIVKKWLGI